MTRHLLCRPASPGAILSKALADSGESLDYVSAVAEIKPKRLRAILDGAYPTKGEVRGLAVVLDRWHVALWREIRNARAACQRWDEEERRIAKEKR